MNASPFIQRVNELLDVGTIASSVVSQLDEDWTVNKLKPTPADIVEQQRKKLAAKKENLKNARDRRGVFAKVDDGGAPDEFGQDWISNLKWLPVQPPSRGDGKLRRNSGRRPSNLTELKELKEPGELKELMEPKEPKEPTNPKMPTMPTMLRIPSILKMPSKPKKPKMPRKPKMLRKPKTPRRKKSVEVSVVDKSVDSQQNKSVKTEVVAQAKVDPLTHAKGQF